MTPEQVELLKQITAWFEYECHDDHDFDIRQIAALAGIVTDQQWEEFTQPIRDRIRRETEERHAAWLQRERENRAKIEAEYEARPEVMADRAATAAMTDPELYARNKALLDQMRESFKQRRLERVK